MGDLGERIEAFYRFLWPFLAADEASVAYLDESPGGRPAAEFLNEIPARYGVGPASRLLDVGCGKGKQLVELARRLGCRVIGIDPLDQNLALARERVQKEGLEEKVAVEKGSMERIPLPDASVNFVWCRDTFNHVEDVDRALAECARVLAPGGAMMNCSALATDWLEPAEAARLAAPVGINPETLSPPRMAAAFRTAGLRVVEHGTTTDEGSPFLEALDDQGARDVLRFAKLLRARSRRVARLGAEDYEILSAYYRWNAYLLIGKITYGVWVLTHEAP
jgi:ubiquinone/menaquinone biosynthesis C-methylase UbiE